MDAGAEMDVNGEKVSGGRLSILSSKLMLKSKFSNSTEGRVVLLQARASADRWVLRK